MRIDITVPHAARMYDYLLGGTSNFTVDRQAVEQAADAVGGLERARAQARANRSFLRRAVRHLAGEARVRQFLDIGTGIPNGDGTLQLAQRIAPAARVVHVDNDPVVLAHAHALLRSTPQGASAYIDADLRDPETILREAAETLDLTRAVALVLAGVLDLVPDHDDPHGVVARLVEALPSGSYLVVSHLTADLQPERMVELADRLNRSAHETFVLRDCAEVRRFFDGVDLLEPGVVPIDRWRPGRLSPATTRRRSPALYAAVGRTR
ncbi:MAG TPA: SAM-dependent methyltransferase [Acidimicrobiales bacterium]